jgi:hypothetical protein
MEPEVMILLTLFALLVAPGLLIQICLNQRLRIFPIVILSTGLFCVNAYLAHYTGGTKEILWAYIAEYGSLLIWLLGGLKRRVIHAHCVWPLPRPPIFEWLPYLGIASSVGIYLSWAGGYFEVPSDVYEHLSRINYFAHRLEQGVVDIYSPWHLLIAICLVLSNSTLDQVLMMFTALLTTWLVVAFFLIAKEMVSAGCWSRTQVNLFGLITAGVVCLTFGTSVFSFVRYYVFAPAFLTYPIYLYLAVCIGKRLIADDIYTLCKSSEAWLVLIGLPVLYLFHRQEALFLLIFLVAGVFVRVCENIAQWLARNDNAEASSTQKIGVFLFVGASGCALVLGLVPVETAVPLANNTVDIGENISSSYPLLIAKPMGRVYETIGLFGLISAAVYFLFLPKAARNYTLSILVIAPLVLIFNPIAVSVFLKVAEQDVVWRLTYMLPFGFLIPYVVFQSSNGFRKFNKKVVAISAVAIGLLLEIPLISTAQQLRYSTLSPVAAGNDYRVWSDVLAELRQFRYRHVLTDPITGYVLTALTENTTFGFKFHGGSKFIDLNVPDYGADSFSGYVGWLVVINQRDGEVSRVGSESGHWPEDVMTIQKHYSKKLLEFLETKPRHFQEIWSKDRVTIYEIVEAAPEAT